MFQYFLSVPFLWFLNIHSFVFYFTPDSSSLLKAKHRKNRSHFLHTVTTESEIHYSTKYKKTFFGLVGELVRVDVDEKAAHENCTFCAQKTQAVTHQLHLFSLSTGVYLLTPVPLKWHPSFAFSQTCFKKTETAQMIGLLSFPHFFIFLNIFHVLLKM